MDLQVRIKQLEETRDICQRHAERIEAHINQQAAGFYGVTLPESILEKFGALRLEQQDFLKGAAEAQAELDQYCQPLLKIVGAFLHEALRERFPISAKTSVVEVVKSQIGWEKTYRYAVPHASYIVTDTPSVVVPAVEVITVHFTQWAETAESYHYAIGYEPSVDTIFVA